MSREILCQIFGGVFPVNIRLFARGPPHGEYPFYETGVLQVYPVGEFLSNQY
jgi:hypothetical protein